MMQLEQAGKRNTAEYARLVEEAKRLANAMYTANSQIKTLTSVKGATLQGFVSGLSGVSGAFTAVNGAMGLFASKNEDVQKIMMKVQSLMSITMGLQAMSATLHQTSAFRLTVLTKVQAAYNAVLLSSGKALIRFGLSAKAARIAAQLLMGTLTLGLAVAIPVIISLISKFTSKQREAKKATEEFNKKVAETASKPIAEFRRLQSEWEKVGDSFQKKISAIQDLKKMFKELGVSINGVVDAEKILTSPENVNAFISAQIAKARATAKQQEIEKLEAEAALAQQKLEEAQKKPKITSGGFSSPTTGSSGFSYTYDNPEIKKQEDAIKTITGKITAAITSMGKYQKEAFELAQKATEGAIITYAAGTIGAIEQIIKEKNEALEGLKGDNKAYLALKKEIDEWEKQLSKLKGSDKNKDTGKDPFTEQLEAAKKSYQEYYKMINAGMGKEAGQAFPELLKGGDSYKEYLQNQKKIILDEADKTQKELSKTQKEKLHKLNAEIASETDKTIISEFQKGLQTEMNNAKSVLDLIELIKEKRKEIETSDEPLKQQKLEIITKESEEADKKAEDETRNLLKSYTDYLDEKINFELQYGDRRKALELQLETELNEEKRKIILMQLAGLEKDRKKYEKQTGDEDYDKLIQEYRSFEQKKTDITEEFNEKRQLLNDKINSSSTTEKERMEAMQSLQQLEKDFQKEMSKFAVDELTNSENWTKLFGNLDNLTIKEIDALIKDIETKFSSLSGQFDTVDLKAITDKLNEAKEVITQRNPFKGLIQGIQEYSKAVDDESKKKALINMLKNASSSLNMLSQGFKSVVNGIKEMGIEMDESTAEMLDDINEMIDASAKLAEGIATKNPLAILEGSINIIKSGIAILDSGAKRRNQQLAEEYEYYNALSDTFDMLIEKQKKLFEQKSGKEALTAYKDALGMVEAKITASKTGLESWFSAGASMFSHSNWYNYDKDLGNILSRQQLLSMSAEEWTKWIGDNAEEWARLPAEVQNYADSVMEAGEQIESLTESMQESITGISFDELTSGIMDLVSQTDLAFSDISDSFYENMKKAVMRMVQTGKLADSIKKWYENLVADLDGGLTDSEVEKRRREYEEIVRKGQEEYESLMKVIGEEINSATTVSSLSGAIKGASQESIDLLAGQTNAVRVNQAQSIEILRNSLIQLTMINANTNKANQYLAQIEKNTNNISNPLRAEGMTE
jgi:hypothetical protein